jgi:hypothetical protein
MRPLKTSRARWWAIPRTAPRTALERVGEELVRLGTRAIAAQAIAELAKRRRR